MSHWGCAGLLAGLITVASSTYAGPQFGQNLDKTFVVTPEAAAGLLLAIRNRAFNG